MSEAVKLTECVNPASRDIDLKTIPEIVDIINAEDAKVSAVVHAARLEIARAVESGHRSLSGSGRLIYVGAGTSGRLGVMDAVECAPTYGIGRDRVFAIIAGGYSAMTCAVEKAEDDTVDGAHQMDVLSVSKEDTIIGLSASGTTPFVRGALQRAKELGATTVGIICNPQGSVLDFADIPIALPTGPEVITGSTRMKAATAQKMTVNTISTAVMIRLGRVTGNFMTAMRPTNEKLRKRACFIVSSICNIDETAAEAALAKHDFNIRSTVTDLRQQEEKK